MTTSGADDDPSTPPGESGAALREWAYGWPVVIAGLVTLGRHLA